MMYALSEQFGALHLFTYLTTRAALATITSLLILLAATPFFVALLSRKQAVQMIRKDGPESHLATKQKTPTMGGVLIVSSVLFSTLLWGNMGNYYLQLALATLCTFAIIGFIDDILKHRKKSSGGMSATVKIIAQTGAALLLMAVLFFMVDDSGTIYFPIFKEASIFLGAGYLAWGALVVIGSSNAVNLTDGLDGLAILPVVLVVSALGLFAYVTGHYYFANYLSLPYTPNSGELIVFCGALCGAGLGFLWFNAYPAQLFMGDVGSLSLGATMGMVALMIKQELLLCVMGIVFVAEALSVIAQVASFKLRGKRVLKMAPLHHHFELSGLKESKIIVRFWITTAIFVLIALLALKVR